MATIYDVAKRAGTSISTVSHYLNQTKYVGPDKAKRVKEAIDALAYVPNRAAKALKTNTSNEIHVVLPNLIDPVYSHTFTGISNAIIDTNYTLILHLTNDLSPRETNLIEIILKSDPAGVILCTCQPENTTLLSRLSSAYPSSFIYRIPKLEEAINSFTYDNAKTLYRITNRLLKLGYDAIALITGPTHYSNESDCIQGYTTAYELNKKEIQPDLLITLPYTKEAAFKYLTTLYENKALPECMIASSNSFTTAIKDLYALRQKKDYLLITLGYESWYNKDLSRTILQTIRDSEKVGFDALINITETHSKPHKREKKAFIYRDDFSLDILDELSKAVLYRPAPPTTAKTLKFLMLDDTTTIAALRSLLPHFESQSGIKVKIDTCSYDKLHQHILDQKASSQNIYDLYSVDMPWIPSFAKKHIIRPIETNMITRHSSNQMTASDYPYRLGRHNDDLYGIPYLIGLQMLFYRNDLFTNQELKESFYKAYHRELAPPTDWFTYNQVARFFTKAYNPASPTTYGTCLADYFQGSLLGEILPRIWGYEGTIVDEDLLPSLCTPQVKKAFESYLEANNYGTKDVNHYAQDVANIFCEGDIAMITSYISYAPIMYDEIHSKIKGLVSFSPMPSESSMVSGWSLCPNYDGQKIDETKEFLEWFHSLDISYRYALITGNPTRHNLFQNSNLNKLYPWLSLSLEIFEKGHTRRVFDDDVTNALDSETIEGIIGHIISKHHSSKSSLHSLLKQADRDLMTLLHH